MSDLDKSPASRFEWWGTDDYQKRIEELEQERDAIGWRWCEDELPEKNGYYMAIESNTSEAIETRFEDGKWVDDDSFAIANIIVQWYKLPEPLKERKEEV